MLAWPWSTWWIKKTEISSAGRCLLLETVPNLYLLFLGNTFNGKKIEFVESFRELLLYGQLEKKDEVRGLFSWFAVSNLPNRCRPTGGGCVRRLSFFPGNVDNSKKKTKFVESFWALITKSRKWYKDASWPLYQIWPKHCPKSLLRWEKRDNLWNALADFS